jgi:hypothetical protein
MFPSLSVFEIPKQKTGELTENSTSVCLLQTEDRNGKFLFVRCKQNWTMEVLFLGRQTINSNQ